MQLHWLLWKGSMAAVCIYLVTILIFSCFVFYLCLIYVPKHAELQDYASLCQYVCVCVWPPKVQELGLK